MAEDDEPGGRYFVKFFGSGGTGGTIFSDDSGAEVAPRSLSEAESAAASWLSLLDLARDCLAELADTDVKLVAVECEPESRELPVVLV